MRHTSAALRAASDEPTSAPHPVLPGAMQRSQVADLLREVRIALGLSSPALDTLLRILDKTRPRDWIDPAAEPVCYAAQLTIAQDLGRTDRQIRTHERVLMKMGLIEDRRRANGSRSHHGQCGLVLSPLIDMVPALLSMRDRLRADRSRVEYLVARRSALYRKAKELTMALQPLHPTDEDLADHVAAFLDWPSSRTLRRLSIKTLEEHHTAARAMIADLDELMQKTADSSGRSEENFHPHIQDTTEETSVYCSAAAHMRSSGKPEGSCSSGSPPTGGESRELKCESVSGARNPEWMDNLTPQRLRSLASADFQLYLDHETGQGRSPRIVDFTLAAIALLPHLGINASAWDDAVGQMGDVTATLCVLVVDANRFHPVTPIRRPGGALRAMTRRHAAGDLNLVGSLIGLQSRVFQEDCAL